MTERFHVISFLLKLLTFGGKRDGQFSWKLTNTNTNKNKTSQKVIQVCGEEIDYISFYF